MAVAWCSSQDSSFSFNHTSTWAPLFLIGISFAIPHSHLQLTSTVGGFAIVLSYRSLLSSSSATVLLLEETFGLDPVKSLIAVWRVDKKSSTIGMAYFETRESGGGGAFWSMICERASKQHR